MPGSDPSGVGNSTTSTVVCSTSVSGSSSSPSSPSSLSSSTSCSVTAVRAFDKLLPKSPPGAFSASGPSASGVGQVDPSPISSSEISTANTAPTFTTAIRGLGVSHAASSPVAYTKAVSSTLPPIITSSSTTPAPYGPGPLGTCSTLITQNGHTSLASVPAALDVSTSWTIPFASYGDHTTCTSTSDSSSELTSTRVPTSNPTYVSNIVVSGASTTSTGSAGAPAHTVTKPPKVPQQIVSALIPIVTQIPQAGSNPQTTTSLGSLVPVPTISSNVSLNSSAISNSLLPFILGSMLGVLVIVALGMIVFRCRARRQSENVPDAHSSGSRSSQERRDWMMIEAPRVNAVTLNRRMASYRDSSIYAPEHINTHLSHAGESSQKSDGQFSDPFAGGSAIVSSRTSMLSASIRSVDSVSTNMEFTVSVNADTRDVGESGRSIGTSTSSLEVHFVAPLATDEPTTRSLYLSSSWHYDSQPPMSSSTERERRNEEELGETSPVSPRAAPKPFFLGTESARLRLHELLKEARGISYYAQENKRTSVDLTLQSRDN